METQPNTISGTEVREASTNAPGECPTSPGVVDPKKKHGDLKDPLHLLPPAFLRQVAHALKHGADKYGEFNWRAEGIKLQMQTYSSAILRHIVSIMDGEWLDKESNMPHLAHIAASVAIVLDAEAHGNLDFAPTVGDNK